MNLEKIIKGSDNGLFLKGGRKVILITDHEAKKSGLKVSYKTISSEGKVGRKVQQFSPEAEKELIPVRGKLAMTASISEKALARAMKAYGKTNGKSKSATGEKPKKVYAFLKKDGKVVAAKLLRIRNERAKISFKVDGEEVTKTVREEFIFPDRDAAKAAKLADKATGKKTVKADGKKSAKAAGKKDEKKDLKVYAVLQKEGKVKAVKVLKEKGDRVKIAFKIDGEEMTRMIKKDLTFEGRDDARVALKEMKSGGKKAEKKTAEKAEKKAAGKAEKKAEKTDDEKPKKVYAILKSQKKVVVGKVVKVLDGKVKVSYKDPEDGEKVTKKFTDDFIFSDKPSARAALKEMKSGGKKAEKKAAGKAEKKEKKAAGVEHTCGDCKFRNPKENDCPTYEDVYPGSKICEDFKLKK